MAEDVQLPPGEAQLSSDGEREAPDPPRMPGRVWVASVHDRRQRLHRRDRALPQQPVRLLQGGRLRARGLCRRARRPEVASLPALEVRPLHPPRDHQRHRGSGERGQPPRLVRERERASEQAVGEIVG